MEKLIQKVRSLTLTLVILAILSLTWVIIDFFVLRNFYTISGSNLDANWIFLILSGVPILLMIAVSFILALFVWRLRSKYHSTLKKIEKEKQKELQELKSGGEAESD